MPNNYNGNPANFDPAVAFVLSQPADLESVTAASEGAEHQKEADAIEYFRQHAALKNLAQTIAALWTYSAGVEFDGGITAESAGNSDTNVVLQTTAAPTHKKLLYRFKVTATILGRIYADLDNSGFAIVINAAVDAAGTTWTADVAGSPALRLLVENTQLVIQYHAAAASWAEGAWGTVTSIAGASGTLQATALSSTGSTAVGNGLTVSAGGANVTGGVTAASGDVNAIAGDLKATSGYVRAERIRSEGGTAHVNVDWTLGAGWGATASINSVTGTDTRGSISVHASGAGIAAFPTLQATFKDGAYPVAPIAIGGRQATTDAGCTAAVQASATTTVLTLALCQAPVNGNDYTLTWWVID